MSDAAFWGISAGAVLIGFVLRRPVFGLAALGLWAIGIGTAALAGAFERTAEDNSHGVFVFTAVPLLIWVAAVLVGIAIRAAVDAVRPAARSPEEA